MSKTNYEIPFNSPVTDPGETTGKHTQPNQGMISLPWQQWAGNMGTAMNTIVNSAGLMTDLNPSTATLADMVAAWEAFRAQLRELV